MRRNDLYSKQAFTEDNLPKNRREVFFDVLKLHYFSFLKMGLILFAFAIPLFVVNFFKDYSYVIAHETGNSNATILITCIAVETVLILLIAIPIAGFGKIYREYVWLEPVFFAADFKSSVKDNIKPTLISAVIVAILNLIFNVIFHFTDNGWIMAIPFGFNVAVFFPIIMHTVFINFIYTNKYWDNFKVGCFFYFKHLPTTILCIILIVGFKAYDLFLLANIIAILTKYLVLLIVVIFILPLVFLGVQLNEMRIFDKHINSIRFPHLVKKGMYTKKKEEEV